MAAWLLGIDEAGYGPNLGPFVMSAALCRVPDDQSDGNLWPLLASTVRRSGEKRDKRLLIDDSKLVYASKSLAALERGVAAVMGELPGDIAALAKVLCPDDVKYLEAETWWTGTTTLPAELNAEVLPITVKTFRETCENAGISDWRVGSVVVCPTAFNAILDRTDTKGAVLAHAFVRLLSEASAWPEGESALHVCTDKQGGRNTYAPQIQHGLPGGMVTVVEESAERSLYRVIGRERPIELHFIPGADAAHFCVAVASMVSKLLRELFMKELNAFWCSKVAGLKPTAGYPADAPRYLAAILPVAKALAVPESAIWRRK